MRIADSNVTMDSRFSTLENKTTATTTTSYLQTSAGVRELGTTAAAATVTISRQGAAKAQSNGKETNASGYTASHAFGTQTAVKKDADGKTSSLRTLAESSLIELNRSRNAFLSGEVSATSITDGFVLLSKEDLESRLLQKLLESLTGKKINMPRDMGEIAAQMKKRYSAQGQNVIKVGGNSPSSVTLPENLEKLRASLQPTAGSNQSILLTNTKIATEYSRDDKMRFDAKAQIQTADGTTINLDINLMMSRSFESLDYTEADIAERLCDPLVINFDGLGVNFTDRKFSFDIDNDGTSDQISQLAAGSGFLALDLNDDGTINDGGELFGTRSGNGFADLAEYDLDSNGWIDENDEIFDKLRIFFTDESGNQKLVGLGEMGIGAIYLGYVRSDYELRDEQNDLQGQITHSGFYLNENGTAGVVQNVDFRIYDSAKAVTDNKMEQLFDIAL